MKTFLPQSATRFGSQENGRPYGFNHWCYYPSWTPFVVLNQSLVLTSKKTLSYRSETQIDWSHLKVFWLGKDTSEGDSVRSKKERKTEEDMGEWTGMGFGDSLRVAEYRERWSCIADMSFVVPQ